ncbi:L-histidine N(alpha)-methyltransferase [Pontibacter sp. G13]|uniref:L-histidine N(alpha)-methyltransferase n=1 Tax=Pontibacter sp. G13 TaxID=3074898 RepID=UPI00288A3069|nr:L-histidine N(alpha)-methyltransferase [Pontibacter sp. G13]WNJ19674.1 L-histidine N(alpha)-methyltransferase [Pontibacter sp. G13]
MALSSKTRVHTAFAKEIAAGLASTPKTLSSKWFYDDRGSELFQQIMHVQDYYLTRTEYEIFETQHKSITQAFGHDPDTPIELIEFGAGDGLKTKLLLQSLRTSDRPFTYHPIDISGGAIRELMKSLKADFPNLNVVPHEADYFTALHELNERHAGQKVILFLGSNIGNFPDQDAQRFLKHLAAEMRKGDQALIGFDLKKDPDVIMRAYNDSEGVTRAFNLNLLERINRELGGNFDLESFRHNPTYDPETGETKSFLLSTRKQKVHLSELGQTFQFEAWETIWTELSQKYDQGMIKRLAGKSGFNVSKNFSDSRNYFVDSLWEKQ